ncbi:MAG: hypothetical protein M5U34_01010 [Chloroflexi bacterium]|nr:hypothetical protein [Chloroflexota bacterium]
MLVTNPSAKRPFPILPFQFSSLPQNPAAPPCKSLQNTCKISAERPLPPDCHIIGEWQAGVWYGDDTGHSKPG